MAFVACVAFMLMTSTLLYLRMVKNNNMTKMTRAASCCVLEEDANRVEFELSQDEYLAQITAKHGYRPELLSFVNKTQRLNHTTLRNVNVVPNIVHFVYFCNGNDYNLEFMHYVSFKGVHKFIEPDLILIWGNCPPSNTTWWNRVQQEVPNVYYVYADRLTQIGGLKPGWIEHETDFMRLKVIYGENFIWSII